MDCGLYWSQHSGGEGHEATVTLLLDKHIVAMLNSSDASLKDEEQQEIIRIIESGQQGGLEVDSVLPFYTKWQKQSLKK